MIRHGLFNFCWVDIEATGDDYFFDARNQTDTHILFNHAGIAGSEPISVESLSCCFGVLEIALKILRAPNQQLTLLTVRHKLVQVLWINNAHHGIWEGDANITRTV